MADTRSHPDRPYVAVSAAIFRDDKVLIVRRARAPAHGLYTLPGGVVEIGESLRAALVRLNEELAEFRWMRPGDLGDLPTTEGLADILAAAQARIGSSS